MPARSWPAMQPNTSDPASFNTTISSFESPSLFSSASSSATMDSSSKESISPDRQGASPPHHHHHHHHQHPHQHRGRSNRKRSESVEENVCVIAFLVRGETAKQKETIEKIQSIRRVYDQAYVRWEPHVTLVPPFIIPFSSSSSSSSSQTEPGNVIAAAATAEDHMPRSLLNDTLEQICAAIQSVCHKVDQHTLTLDEVGHFTLKRYDTVHLRPGNPAKDNPFLRLQNDLELALPQAMQSLRNKGKAAKDSYNPHLTLGQSFNVKSKEEIYGLAAQALNKQEEFAKEEPLRIKVDKIQLMVKPVNRSGPYDIYREISLR